MQFMSQSCLQLIFIQWFKCNDGDDQELVRNLYTKFGVNFNDNFLIFSVKSKMS